MGAAPIRGRSPPDPPEEEPVTTLIRSERGATLVEYGLIVAFIALAAFVAVTFFGIQVNGLFDKVDLLEALR